MARRPRSRFGPVRRRLGGGPRSQDCAMPLVYDKSQHIAKANEFKKREDIGLWPMKVISAAATRGEAKGPMDRDPYGTNGAK